MFHLDGRSVERWRTSQCNFGKSPDDLQGKQNAGSLRNESLNERPIRDQNWAKLEETARLYEATRHEATLRQRNDGSPLLAFRHLYSFCATSTLCKYGFLTTDDWQLAFANDFFNS